MALLVLSLLVLVGCARVGDAQGWPSGVVENGTLFIGTQDGDFRALDTATGKMLWSFRLRLRGEDEDGRAIYGAPVISEDAIYFAGYGGMLYVDSLSAADGPVPTYLDLLRIDAETIANALAPAAN